MFETPPRVVPGGAQFRETLVVGVTLLSRKEVDELLKRFSREYLGDRYHLLFRNVRARGQHAVVRCSVARVCRSNAAVLFSATTSVRTCANS